jgi:hypothetical protein
MFAMAGRLKRKLEAMGWEHARTDKLVSAMVAEPDQAEEACRRRPPHGIRREVKGYVNGPNWFFWHVALS